MVRGRVRGGKGSLCPPPPRYPKSPHLDPPPQPTLPEPPTPPLLYPPHSPSLNPPSDAPPPPLPPPQGASGQQLVGGVVGVQDRGVAPPCQLHIGDFVHHPDGRAIVLELVYKGTPVQVVNIYMSAEGTAKEYCPLLQWLRTHGAPDSQLVLMGGDFQCNPGWSADCVSVNTKIAPVLSEFAADMTLLPFTHGMCGPTWVRAQGFVGAFDFFLSRHGAPEIGNFRVESEFVFPSDRYPVRLCLHTLPALVPPGNPASRARFNQGASVCKWQQETFADSCTGLRSLPPAATPEAYRHSVGS